MKRKQIQKQIKLWFWAGRVVPLIALAILLLELAFDLNTFLEYTMVTVVVVFSVFAFTWWWWVLDTVKTIFGLLTTAQDKFEQVILELSEIKTEVKNADNRERSKSKEDKSQ